MPHNGHTTINMSSHPRSRSPNHHATAGHEDSGVHRGPVSNIPLITMTPVNPANRINHGHPNANGHHTGNDHHIRNRGNGHHIAANEHHRNGNTIDHHTVRNDHDNSSHGSGTSSHSRTNHAPPEEAMPLLHRPRRDVSPKSDPNIPEAHSINVSDTEARPKLDLKLDIDLASNRAQPLIEPDINSPRPPIAGPETDDLDDEDDIPNTAEAHPGVDDGFFSPGNDNNPDFKPTDEDGHHHSDGPGFTPPLEGKHGEDGYGDDRKTLPEGDENDGFVPGTYGPSLTPRFGSETPFPYAPEFAPGATPRVIPDVNVYQQKKNLAQGMMDLALLSANANQLRYVLEAGDLHPYFYPSLIFIIASLILQIGVGVGLIVNSTYDIKDRYDICKADRINNFTVIGIFLITVVNVFIASFGVAQMPQAAPAVNTS